MALTSTASKALSHPVRIMIPTHNNAMPMTGFAHLAMLRMLSRRAPMAVREPYARANSGTETPMPNTNMIEAERAMLSAWAAMPTDGAGGSSQLRE